LHRRDIAAVFAGKRQALHANPAKGRHGDLLKLQRQPRIVGDHLQPRAQDAARRQRADANATHEQHH
jgi:hypothetical protein